MVGFLSQLAIISKWYAIQKTTVLRETTLPAQSLYTIRDTKTTVPYRLFSLARDSRVRQNKTGHHPTEAASGTLAFPPKFPEAGCFHGYFLKIRKMYMCRLMKSARYIVCTVIKARRKFIAPAFASCYIFAQNTDTSVAKSFHLVPPLEDLVLFLVFVC